jgi:hypothetical protein
MMLKLILHSSPEPLRKWIRRHSISSRFKLCPYKIRLILFKQFLRLVSKVLRINALISPEMNTAGTHTPNGSTLIMIKIMGKECVQFLLCPWSLFLHGRNGDLHGIKTPQCKQERKWNEKNQMLDFAKRAIVFRVRSPSE